MPKLGGKYKKAQCVAFEVSTMDYAWKQETGSYESKYPANNNDDIDYKLRLDFTKEIIDKAYNSSSIDSKDSTLKVLMLPEFFYRGENGSYDLETTSKVVEGLREMVKDPKYNDWLFVFGTIVGQSKEGDAFEPYNFSFIQKGNGEEKDSLIVMKEFKSSIDFVNSSPTQDNSILLNNNTKHLNIINPETNRNEEKKLNYDGNSIFEVDGIRFSLEICLDHKMKRIDNSLENKSFSKINKLIKPIHMQLVTSSGVDPETMDLSGSLHKNGHAFICDGSFVGSKVQSKKEGDTISTISKETVEFSNAKQGRPEQKIFRENKGDLTIYETFSINKSLNLDIKKQTNNISNRIRRGVNNVFNKILNRDSSSQPQNIDTFQNENLNPYENASEPLTDMLTPQDEIQNPRTEIDETIDSKENTENINKTTEQKQLSLSERRKLKQEKISLDENKTISSDTQKFKRDFENKLDSKSSNKQKSFTNDTSL